MERVLALGQDMALLWARYAPLYLSGVVNTAWSTMGVPRKTST